MTTRKGYLVALAVFLGGLALAGIFVWRVYDRVQGMPRVEMPGEQTVTLPAGELVVYAEQPSGHAGEFSVSTRCQVRDAAGAELALSTPGTTTSYTMGRYQGGSMYELTVPKAGPVTVTCASDDRFVLAFGEGIGTSIALGAISGVVGFFAALFIVIRTWRRRRRERKAAEATAATF